MNIVTEHCLHCNECQHSGTGSCNYSKNTDNCRRNPPAPVPQQRNLWMRLGVLLSITDGEADAIMGDDKSTSVDTLLGVICAGRFKPDGESYIPGVCIEDYNSIYGTEFDDKADVEFNL